MKVPFSYNWRNLWARKLTTGLTVIGISLVVFVFAAVLMLSEGIRDTMVATGSKDNVIIIRKGSTSDLLSVIMRDQIDLIATFPEMQKNPDGSIMASADVVTMINLDKKGSGDMGNIYLRGMANPANNIRSQVKLTEGRWFRPGQAEAVVGNKVHDLFQGAEVGKEIEIGSRKLLVVGVMDAGKTGFASEIWSDSDLILNEYNRANAFSTFTFHLGNQDDFEVIKTRLSSEKRLQDLEVKREQDYYLEQSQFMATFITALGLVVTIIFSFGAMIGAMITMYAAVSNRTTEIGTLRALGFKRRSIMTAFLVEAVVLALIGCLVGLVLASGLQAVTFSTTNFGTFSELAFGFSMSTATVISTVVFALIMGLVGGFLPAVRASRLNIVSALRAEG